jgi:hypothetical protein
VEVEVPAVLEIQEEPHKEIQEENKQEATELVDCYG